MRQPAFYLSNRDRRAAFATETVIYDRGTVIKRAAAPQAASHIEHMAATFESLRALNLAVEVVPAKQLGGDSISFAYIEGASAENVMAQKIVNGQLEAALSMLDKVCSVIESLPSVKANPVSDDRFIEVFGNNYEGKSDCSSLGLIDLNFDNFIIDQKGVWHLFDYEWCFDFAIPKDLLIQRVLFWFFVVRFQKLLLLHSAKYPMVRIADDVFIPEFVYQKHKRHFDNLRELTAAETKFQIYVHNISQSNKLFEFSFLSTPEVLAPADLAEARLNLSMLGRAQFIHQQFEMALKINKDLETHIKAMEQSRSYKVARALQKSSSKLRPKK